MQTGIDKLAEALGERAPIVWAEAVQRAQTIAALQLGCGTAITIVTLIAVRVAWKRLDDELATIATVVGAILCLLMCGLAIEGLINFMHPEAAALAGLTG